MAVQEETPTASEWTDDETNGVEIEVIDIDDEISFEEDQQPAASASTAVDDDSENEERWSEIQQNGEKTTTSKLPSKPHCGLNEVCAYFLGKPLKKSEQFSNWSRRPLRQEQIRYAGNVEFSFDTVTCNCSNYHLVYGNF